MEAKIGLEQLKKLLGEEEASLVKAQYGHRLDEESQIFLEQMFLLEDDLADAEKHLPPLPNWQPPGGVPQTGKRRLSRWYLGLAAAALVAVVLLGFVFQEVPDSKHDHLRSPGQKNETEATDLLQAVKQSNLKRAEQFIQAGSSLTQQDEMGRNALHTAAANDDPEMLQLLIDAGSPVDDCDRAGQTALIIAASMGNLGCTELLLRAGADKTISDHQGETAEMHAAKVGYGKILQLLRE